MAASKMASRLLRYNRVFSFNFARFRSTETPSEQVRVIFFKFPCMVIFYVFKVSLNRPHSKRTVSPLTQAMLFTANHI